MLKRSYVDNEKEREDGKGRVERETKIRKTD